MEIEKGVIEKYSEIIDNDLYTKQIKPFYYTFISKFSSYKKDIENKSNEEIKFSEKNFIEKRQKEFKINVEDKIEKIKKLIKDYQIEYHNLEEIMENSVLLKINNITREFNNLVKENITPVNLYEKIKEIINEIKKISVSEDKNNYIQEIIMTLEQEKKILYKNIEHKKYENIRKQFKSMNKKYTKLSELDQFSNNLNKCIALINGNKYNENLKNIPNEKNNKLKELLKFVTDIKSFNEYLNLESKTKNYNKEIEKYSKESEKYQNEIEKIKQKINDLNKKNEEFQIKINKLNENINTINTSTGKKRKLNQK